jgi:cytochrome c-type biogenesis protein CcmH
MGESKVGVPPGVLHPVIAPILLIVLLIGVAACVGAYVLWPLLRRPAADVQSDAAGTALAVLRERRRELEASLAHLPADAPERRAALAEFAAQAESELPATPSDTPPDPPSAPRRPLLALVLAALLILPTFAFYLLAGAPEAASPEFRAAAREPANLDELAADLKRRLRDDPDAVDGWRLLGRAELARGNPDQARRAFERALELLPGDAQARVDLADATAQAQGAVLEGRPIELIREALAIDARNPKALALAGAYEVTRGDAPAAIAHWKRLLDVLPADSDQARQVAGFVADLQAGRQPRVAPRPADPAAGTAAGGTPGAPAAGGPPVAAATPPAPPPGASPTAPGPTAPGTLRGRIEVERSLAARVRPDDTLFVVARTVDDAGVPVGPPVAVLRARGTDLPLEFALDDRQSMSPAARLSTVPEGSRVVVIARVSRTGEAAARTGDLQGASQPIRPGAAGLRVLIDAVID